jgi:hypothetical protein
VAAEEVEVDRCGHSWSDLPEGVGEAAEALPGRLWSDLLAEVEDVAEVAEMAEVVEATDWRGLAGTERTW